MRKELFGKKVKELREARGESQSALAEALKIGLKQVQRYEKGELPPTHENLEVLCEHYQYDFISLLYDMPSVPRRLNDEADSTLSIEFNTASGKRITIIPAGKKEFELLNAFLEERESRISTYEKENERLSKVIDSGLVEIKVSLTSVTNDLDAIEFGQRAQHTVMIKSLERIEKMKPGTLQKELSIAERAYQSGGEQVGSPANKGK